MVFKYLVKLKFFSNDAVRNIFKYTSIEDAIVKIIVFAVITSYSIVLLLKFKELNFSILYPILFLLLVVFAAKKIVSSKGVLGKYGVPVFLLMGLILRLYWGMYSGAPLTSDHSQYFWMGQQILEGKFFFHPFKQSGAGVFTALSFFLTNQQTIPSALFPIAFGSWLQCLLGYHGLKTLGYKTAAVGFCIWTCLWPEHWLTVNMLAAANYLGIFFVVAWWLIVQSDRQSSNIKILFFIASAGISIGIMQFIRGTGVFVLAGFIFQMFYMKSKLRNTATLVLSFGLTVLPIYMYNKTNLGINSISPSQNSGVSLLIGTNISTNGHYFPEYNDNIVEKMIYDLRNSTDTRENHYESDEKLKSILTMENFLFKPVEMSKWAVLRNEAAKTLALQNIQSNPWKQLSIAIGHKMPIYWGESTSLAWSLDNTELFKVYSNLQKFNDNSILILLFMNVLFLVHFLVKSKEFTPFYGALLGCFLMGSLHLFVEIQSQYHLSHLTLYPLFAFMMFREKQLT